MSGLSRLGLNKPTPIQKAAIPVGMQGKDIIAIARTGSGKTLAFGIPMLQRLSKIKGSAGMIIVPTRELAMQVEEVLRAASQSLHFRSAVLIGGASISLQRTALKKNPRLIVATPGRLLDHIQRKTIDLANIEVFVLDEADRMLDMGFIHDIEKIVESIPDKRQTMLFSATMSDDIEAIADKFMKYPVRIEIDRSGATPIEVSHETFFVRNQDKSSLLAIQLKKHSGSVLVFTRTKRTASRLTDRVKKMGFAAAEIHSNRSLGQRRHALDGFKSGNYRVLIATDIAARGIDVTGIEMVVNYDIPATSKDYVHRIGRTGRAGKTGHAVSFATADQKGSIRDIERFMKTKMTISALPAMTILKSDSETADRIIPGSEPQRKRSSQRHNFKTNDFRKNQSKRIKPKTNAFGGKKGSGSARRRKQHARRTDF